MRDLQHLRPDSIGPMEERLFLCAFDVVGEKHCLVADADA
jgi:hypothetical protein